MTIEKPHYLYVDILQCSRAANNLTYFEISSFICPFRSIVRSFVHSFFFINKYISSESHEKQYHDDIKLR